MYSSHIANGSLLADTKTILLQWDAALSVEQNLIRVCLENTLAKPSRAYVRALLPRIRKRFLFAPALLPMLVRLAQCPALSETLDRVLYLLALRSEPLLADAVAAVVLPCAQRPLGVITGLGRKAHEL